MMTKNLDPVAEKILSLTLEIISLLSGEDYMIVRKPSDCVPPSDSPRVSDGPPGTRSPSPVPPPHSPTHERNREQKILELTNKMMSLLTGEVPVRCDDVTVYFSMEEWEYLEGHKELYRDVMMETHQPRGSPGRAAHVQNGRAEKETHDGEECMATRPRKTLCKAPNTGETETSGEDCLNVKKDSHPTAGHAQRNAGECPCVADGTQIDRAFTLVKDRLSTGEDGDPEGPSDVERLAGGDVYRSERMSANSEQSLADRKLYGYTEHAPLGYKSLRVKEEAALGDGDPSELEPEMGYIAVHIKEESLSGDEGDVTDWAGRGEGIDPPALGRNGSSAQPGPLTAEKVYDCTECEKSFNRSSDFVKHQSVHTKKRLSCPKCGKLFSYKANLASHQRVHNRVKSFTCSDCGKSFIWKSHLVRHQKIHTGEKPFPCSECGKCFLSHSHLITHRRIHTGEKPFSCSDCGKRFTQSSSLTTHQRTHTGEKPYVCPACGKGFKNSTGLAMHKKTHGDFHVFLPPQ